MKMTVSETSAEFRELMRAAEIPLSHLEPRHPSTVAASIASDTAEALRGLAQAYSVPVTMMLRAAVVIGLETLLGESEELGHGPQTPA